jgi:hypothetical protein
MERLGRSELWEFEKMIGAFRQTEQQATKAGGIFYGLGS